MADGRYTSTHTGSTIDEAVTKVDTKQDRLVPGSNIKNINDQSIMGSGSLEVVGHIGGASGEIILGEGLVMHGTTLDLDVDSGTIVEANPGGIVEDYLRTIRIGNTVYGIRDGGGGGGGGSGSITYIDDTTTTAINATLDDKVDRTFHAEAESVSVTVPAGAGHGYVSSITFLTGVSAPAVTFVTSQATHPVKLVQYGRVISQYYAAANSVATLLAYDNGISTDILIYETPQAS